MSNLAKTLVDVGNHDPSIRTPAEQRLKQFEAQNLPAYLLGLCEQVKNVKMHVNVRLQASIALKNTIVAKSEQKRLELENRWSMLQPQIRSKIKLELLHTLGVPERKLRNSSAMVIAKIAAIEIPKQMWPGLVRQLVQVIADKKTADPLKEACFSTLGFVCEECPDELEKESNLVLDAIASGMAKEQTNTDIKLEATKALANSLDLAQKNMSVPRQRKIIMSMIFSAAKTKNSKVQRASFECLAAMATSYYQFIGEYMNPIYELTSAGIKSGNEDIAMQAIEFWSAICDEEIEIDEEALEHEGKSSVQPRKNFRFMKTAARRIVPLLFVCLTKQSEDPDDEEWDVAHAAGNCFQLMAQNIGDDIVPLVLPFIKTNITNSNWRLKEAATLTFACILDGPSKAKLAPMVKQAFRMILEMMKSGHPQVKHTVAWTIGKICEFLPETIGADLLPHLMGALSEGLKESPKIASLICWAIFKLAEQVQVQGNTSALSKYFPGVVKALLVSTSRQDADQNLLVNGFEALGMLVHNAAPDSYNYIVQLIPELMGRLKATFGGMSTSQNKLEAQALLCGALQYAVQRLEKSPAQIQQYLNPMMELFCSVLNSKNAECHGEALLAIAAVARLTGPGFMKYMKIVGPFILRHLKDTMAYEVCANATGLVGDIARAVETKLAPYCNEIVQELLRNLQNGDLDRNVKPQILNCLGDIALAIRGSFQPYLPWVMKFLESAGRIEFKSRDNDNIDYLNNLEYLNTLRESVVETYISILNGLYDDGKCELFLQHMEKLMALLHRISNDKDVEPDVIKTCCSLLGDLADLLGTDVRIRRYLVTNHVVKRLVQIGMESQTKGCRDQANQTLKKIEALMGKA